MTKITEKNRVLLLIFIMTTCSLVIVGITIGILYHTAFEQEKKRFSAAAKGWVHLMEAVARFDAIYSKDYPNGSYEATLSQITDASKHSKGFGKSGEFILCKKEDNNIIFIIIHQNKKTVKSIPFDSELAESMRLSLSGKSGSIIGLDYEGKTVLAAYELVSAINMGFIIKMDIAEIRKPFINVALLAIFIAFFIISAGSILFIKITQPIIQKIKQHAEEVEKERQKILSVLEMLPGFVCLQAFDYTIKFTNKKFRELFNESESKLCYEIFSNCETPCEDCPTFKVFSTKHDRVWEWRGPKGRTYIIYAYPFCYENCEMVMKIGIDITEYKLTEDAIRIYQEQMQQLVEAHTVELEQSEALLRSFFDSPNIMRGIVEIIGDDVFHIKDNVVSANFFGHSTESMKDKFASGLGVPKEIIRMWINNYEKSRQTGQPVTFEYVHNLEDGIIHLSATVCYLGISNTGHPRFAYNARDISRRKKAEEQLQIFKTIIESSHEAIAISDPQGQLIYINPAHERLFGRTYEEARRINYRHYFTPESVKILDNHITPAIARGQSWEGEIDVFDAKSRRFPLWERAGSVLDKNGNMLFGFGFMHDITERRRAEEALKLSELNYRKLAEENKRLLEQALKDAETKNMLLQEVNHRVKNNLAAIIGLIYAENRYAQKENQEAYRTILKDIMSRIRGMSEVHNMLSASQWQPIPLYALTEKIVSLTFNVLPPDKNIILNIKPELIKIKTKHAGMLAMVINELATNAVKYALADRPVARISFCFYLENNKVIIVYQDDGPGFPEDVLNLERHSTGFYLIKNLVCHDLGGELLLKNDNGAVLTIRFKND